LSSERPNSGYARRRRETALRIVEAAGTLFGERGMSATTVADICERAGVARQTFFNHFSTKQDVADELARIGHDWFLEALDTARLESGSLRERLKRVFGEIYTAAQGAGPMHRDLVSEVIRASYEATGADGARALQRGVEKLLRAGRADGDVSRRHTLEDQSQLVLATLHFLIVEWAHRKDFDIAERSEHMANLLADLLAPTPEERK